MKNGWNILYKELIVIKLDYLKKGIMEIKRFFGKKRLNVGFWFFYVIVVVVLKIVSYY